MPPKPEQSTPAVAAFFLYRLFCTACIPLLLLAALLRVKERERIWERLGLKSRQTAARLGSVGQGPVIWIHALSVGEVTSALPLVQAVRAQLHPAQIVFTAATRSGRELAETLIRPHVDLVLFSPFDLWFSVRRYIVAIRPSLFVLVETDFWPEWLHMLHQEKVPTMLVNGRISSKSFASYRRFAFFCKPMFRCFDLLAMQTEQDREKMAAFGLPKERLAVLGNLKYDLPAPQSSPLALVPDNELLWVCGSTHPGEEEIIFAAFQQLLAETELHGTLHLLLAPRQINRGEKLLRLASSFGFVAQLRSSGGRSAAGRVLIVDSLGELAGCYSAARLAFIGGSLAAEGGHNPLEAAAQGVPVLFGPHTDDFAEITRDLTECGGAKRVTEASLAATAALILTDETVHAAMANAAKRLVKQQRGAAARHLSAINLLLRLCTYYTNSGNIPEQSNFARLIAKENSMSASTDLLTTSTNLQKAVAWFSETMQQHPDKQRAKVLAEAELRFDLTPAECEFLRRHFRQADG